MSFPTTSLEIGSTSAEPFFSYGRFAFLEKLICSGWLNYLWEQF